MQVLLDSKPVRCSFAADEADAYCSIVRSFKTGDLQQAGCTLDMPHACTSSLDMPNRTCELDSGCFQGSHMVAGQRLDVRLPMTPRLETLQVLPSNACCRTMPCSALLTTTADCHSTLLCVQDDRPVFRAFKSLLIGPHLYAGLTHGRRTVVADPKQIASMVAPLTSEGPPT